MSSANCRTAAVEQQLVRSGPAAVDEQRLTRLLGRRDDLDNKSDRRRYDELVGRVAVADFVRAQLDTPGRWL